MVGRLPVGSDQGSFDDDDASSTAHREYAAQAQDELNMDLEFTIGSTSVLPSHQPPPWLH